jgi:hypothetical protein
MFVMKIVYKVHEYTVVNKNSYWKLNVAMRVVNTEI